MADPDTIKIEVMDALLEDVKSITDFNPEMVELRPPTVLDEDTAVYPLGFVWDDSEDTNPRNRLEEGVISANIAIWCEGRDYHKQAERIRGKIKARIYGAESSLRALRAACQETRAEKFYVILEDEASDTIMGLGGLTMRLELKYLAKRENPFSQSDY